MQNLGSKAAKCNLMLRQIFSKVRFVHMIPVGQSMLGVLRSFHCAFECASSTAVCTQCRM